MIHLSRYARIITPVRHDKAHPSSPPYGIPTEFHLTLKVWPRENIAVARAEKRDSRTELCFPPRQRRGAAARAISNCKRIIIAPNK